MRSVFVFLNKVEQVKIIEKLNAICENKNNLQWIYMKNDDPILYIEFDKNKSLLKDFEENTRKRIETILCGKLEHILIIDISGRHSGEKEVLLVLKKLLESFHGYGMDDYTEELWTLEEIISGHKKKIISFLTTLGGMKKIIKVNTVI